MNHKGKGYSYGKKKKVRVTHMNSLFIYFIFFSSLYGLGTPVLLFFLPHPLQTLKKLIAIFPNLALSFISNTVNTLRKRHHNAYYANNSITVLTNLYQWHHGCPCQVNLVTYILHCFTFNTHFFNFPITLIKINFPWEQIKDETWKQGYSCGLRCSLSKVREKH